MKNKEELEHKKWDTPWCLSVPNISGPVFMNVAMVHMIFMCRYTGMLCCFDWT